MIESLKMIYTRDLNRLKSEIDAYEKEENLWKIDQSILNSAGNLCLHLTGNLQFFIGAELGNSGYIRNREAEFSLKNIPKVDLINKIDTTLEVVYHTLGQISEEKLKEIYPLEPFGYPMSTEYFLLHLSTHLNYHLGQINYHRRLLDIK